MDRWRLKMSLLAFLPTSQSRHEQPLIPESQAHDRTSMLAQIGRKGRKLASCTDTYKSNPSMQLLLKASWRFPKLDRLGSPPYRSVFAHVKFREDVHQRHLPTTPLREGASERNPSASFFIVWAWTIMLCAVRIISFASSRALPLTDTLRPHMTQPLPCPLAPWHRHGTLRQGMPTSKTRASGLDILTRNCAEAIDRSDSGSRSFGERKRRRSTAGVAT